MADGNQISGNQMDELAMSPGVAARPMPVGAEAMAISWRMCWVVLRAPGVVNQGGDQRVDTVEVSACWTCEERVLVGGRRGLSELLVAWRCSFVAGRRRLACGPAVLPLAHRTACVG